MVSLVSLAHAEPTPSFGYTTYYIYQPFAPPALHVYQHLPIILFYYPPPPPPPPHPPPSNLSNIGNYIGTHHPPSTSRSSEGRLVRHRNYKPKPSSSVVIPFPCTSTPQQLTTSSPTTVMVKNIPNNIRRASFLRILKRHCWEENRGRKSDDPNKSMFNFVYLPTDFRKTISNLGYAFVNFTTPVAARRFYRHFHRRKWNILSQNSKICEVACAKIQGKRALFSRFEHKRFWCNHEECLPVIVEPACDGTEWPEIYTVGILGGAYI